MRDWLGHEIEVGTVVGRGVRSGNTTSWTIGTVTELDEAKLKVRVVWKYTSAPVYHLTPNGKFLDGSMRFGRELIAFGPAEGSGVTQGKGSLCTVESVFVLPPGAMERADKMRELRKNVYKVQQDGTPVDRKEWDRRVEAALYG